MQREDIVKSIFNRGLIKTSNHWKVFFLMILYIVSAMDLNIMD